MKNKRTYYQLILDRSGSMTSCIEQTVAGVNRQIRRIRELADRFPEQELLTSLTLFNTEVSQSFDRIRPEALRELTAADYVPAGLTALLDAVGSTLIGLQKAIGPQVENNEASVVVVIITDGYENASQSFTHHQVSSLIRDLELSGKWSFSYLGATIDAVDIAVSLNISSQNAVSFNTCEIEEVGNRLADQLEDYMEVKKSGKVKSGFLGKNRTGGWSGN